MALSVLMLTAALSCSKDGTGRRRGTEERPNVTPVSAFRENPAWTVTYTGRTADVFDGNTFIVDVMHVKSTDNKTWYLDLVSANDLLTTYGNSLDQFIAASVAKAKEAGDIPVDSGDSDVVFDILDAGGSNWVAVAYGCDEKGNLTGEYSRLDFTTQAMQLQKGSVYKMEYTGRRESDGDEVDVLNVKTDSPYSYYVYIAYPEYIEEFYEGDYAAFFNGVVDEIYSGLGENGNFADAIYYQPNLNIEFDRFRSGQWTAYAFGLDAAGNLTGDWSEYAFVVPEEKPTDAYNRWLGTWRIGDGRTAYEIRVAGSESNVAYRVSGWETGDDAGEGVTEETKDLSFETRFDRKTGEMIFYVQYIGFPFTVGEETFDAYLLGVYRSGSDEFVYEFESDIAAAALDESGNTATVRALSTERDGKTISFVSMRYGEMSRNASNNEVGIHAQRIPYFPMTMTWVSSNTGSAAAVRTALPTARPRMTVRTAGTKSAAPAGASVSPYRKAAGTQARKASGRKPGSVRRG